MTSLFTSRKGRILLGVLLPPAFGASFLAVPLFIRGYVNDDGSTAFFLFAVYWFAFLIMGIPSLFYAFVMEYFVNRKLDSDMAVIVLSAIMGGLAGSIFLLSGRLGAGLIYTFIGILVGAAVGMILRKNFNRELANEPFPSGEAAPLR